ncbi:uncharacterized protein LOC117180146 [Belonocnema kinseyi]|uniref:uncharacterized protein LOC117180146 n=1 Tax=Belonocnema kinseyi TaxID=2817044 RepID=UPI00143D8848|nr:uncharacterized protein LOC117180146 [Belonocnema kinseyi]
MFEMGKRSVLWKHFVAKDKNTSMCRYCDKEIKSSENTSNMRNHMQVSHFSIWNEEETNSANKLKEKIKITPENTASTSSQKDSYASPAEVPSTPSQTQNIPATASQKDDFFKKSKENIQESFSSISSFKEGGETTLARINQRYGI